MQPFFSFHLGPPATLFPIPLLLRSRLEGGLERLEHLDLDLSLSLGGLVSTSSDNLLRLGESSTDGLQKKKEDRGQLCSAGRRTGVRVQRELTSGENASRGSGERKIPANNVSSKCVLRVPAQLRRGSARAEEREGSSSGLLTGLNGVDGERVVGVDVGESSTDCTGAKKRAMVSECRPAECADRYRPKEPSPPCRRRLPSSR